MALTAGTSLIDRIYGAFANRTMFFEQGWGRLSDIPNVDADATEGGLPPAASVRWNRDFVVEGCELRRGEFESPFCCSLFPQCCRTAQVELILPRGWTRSTPVCIHFAATGDQGFDRRRRSMAIPLAKRGIGALLLENAFYGRRRPEGQKGKTLRTFADLWMMGVATVQEGIAMLGGLREQGFERLGVTGISMGGHMAASVAALWPAPLAVAPCIAPHSAQVVFTEGLLMKHCDWNVLDGASTGREAAVRRMRDLLAVTDLRRYDAPKDPRAAVLVSARRDAYIPSWSPMALHEHWPGSEHRWLDAGHVTAFLFKRAAFHDAVADAFAALSGGPVIE